MQLGSLLARAMGDLREKQYQDTFDATIAQLTMRRRTEMNFTLHECQKILESEYINQGNNWVGRGSLQDIVQEATIAAYEVFIAEWRHERDQS
ncbi:hypothetical protein EH223_08020 [candidate division KSB1 bacterium]|nr:hypothetical protein [candidate division KSB1 bacterium]RQW04139.1 MAG: hypothetical protein EH223_08020 [candidate division KSB1 bacterium]